VHLVSISEKISVVGLTSQLLKQRLLSVSAAISLCFVSSCSNVSKNTSSVFTNAYLAGNYNYVLAGTSYNVAGSQPYQEAGTFVADGNGNITGGVDDFVQSSALTTSKITGTYKVSSDGCASITLKLSRGTVQLAITLLSSSSFYVIEFDSLASGSGEALLQNTTAFSGTPQGTFVFRLHSSVAGSAAVSSVSNVGQMTVQGGGITGTEDFVRDGVPGSTGISGVMNPPDANGRGTVDLNDTAGHQSNYIYYVIDSNTMKFLETDPGPLGSGRADAQSGGPFSNTSMKGGFCFRGRGDTLASSFGYNSVGAFVGDGNGNITSGSYDAVQDGTATTNAPLTGNYSLAANGRASIVVTPKGMSPISLIVWMVNPSSGLLLVNGPNLSVVGRIDLQQDTPFSASSLKGRFAFYMFGTETPGSPLVNRVGDMTFDGNVTVTFNDYYINRGGTTAQNGPVGGNYAVSSNGRVLAFSVGAVNYQVMYLISNQSGSLMLIATGSELAGSFSQQGTSAGPVD